MTLHEFQLVMLCYNCIPHTHIHTLGSNSTVSSATPGESVVALIIFAALYCGFLVLCCCCCCLCWRLCSQWKKDMMKEDTRENKTEGNMREDVNDDDCNCCCCCDCKGALCQKLDINLPNHVRVVTHLC